MLSLAPFPRSQLLSFSPVDFLLVVVVAACIHRMISAWDTFFEVDDYYTYKKPVGHGAYGVVISALDTRDNSKV